jgi:hypothetical protein
MGQRRRRSRRLIWVAIACFRFTEDQAKLEFVERLPVVLQDLYASRWTTPTRSRTSSSITSATTSFTRFCRPAPVKPEMRRARVSRPASGTSDLPCEWISAVTKSDLQRILGELSSLGLTHAHMAPPRVTFLNTKRIRPIRTSTGAISKARKRQTFTPLPPSVVISMLGLAAANAIVSSPADSEEARAGIRCRRQGFQRAPNPCLRSRLFPPGDLRPAPDTRQGCTPRAALSLRRMQWWPQIGSQQKDHALQLFRRS